MTEVYPKKRLTQKYKKEHTAGFYRLALRDPALMKKCPVCTKTKHCSEFRKAKEKKDGFKAMCKSCSAVKDCERDKNRPARSSRNPDGYRAWRLKKKFDITLNDYEALLVHQDGVCAICKRPPKSDRRLAVDHCHETDLIRGLLCNECNRGLGLLGDSAESLSEALRYLSQPRTRTTPFVSCQ